LRERLHEYLLARHAGATSDELLDLIFTSRGGDPEFGARFLATLLGSDPRFRFDSGAQRWRAAVHDVLARPLAEVPFVVLDLETTGEAPAPEGIIEVGAVRMERGRVTATFHSLVNPRRPIHPFVVRLTGITDEMVSDAPAISAVLPGLVSFIGDAAVVAHNAPFDVSHLDVAHRQQAGRPFAPPVLCTLRLARRLLPELRRRSLDSVAASLGVSCFGRHRALPDATIAADVFAIFLERVAERGIVRLDQLLDFQRSAADGRPFIVHLSRARLETAPPAPGVYHLLGADGRLLYVGKARRLRERLASYFANARGHSPKTLDLIRHTYDFRTTETGSELAASLLEARQIRELKPPYNRQRRHLPRVGFLKLSVRSAYARVWVTQRLGTDRALYLGPFPSLQVAERTLSAVTRAFALRTCPGTLAPSPLASPCLSGQLGTCSAPCAARVDELAYRRQVDAVLAFLEGANDDGVARLAARRDELARALRFESAARAQRDLDLLDGLRRRRRDLGWVVGRQNFLVLLPTTDHDHAQLYVVLGGRLAVEARIAAAADLVAIVGLVRERFARYQDAPLEREDVEAATILAAWLRDRGHEGLLLPLEGADDVARRLDELVVTVADLSRRGPLPAIEGL